jgi:hypothetical protein
MNQALAWSAVAVAVAIEGTGIPVSGAAVRFEPAHGFLMCGEVIAVPIGPRDHYPTPVEECAER